MHTAYATERIPSVCHECLEDGRIVRCESCGDFTHSRSRFHSGSTPDRVSCAECGKMFEFRVHGLDQTVMVEGVGTVRTDYFYKRVAEQIGVDPSRLTIRNLNRGMMMSTGEYAEKKKWRTFDVIVHDVPVEQG